MTETITPPDTSKNKRGPGRPRETWIAVNDLSGNEHDNVIVTYNPRTARYRVEFGVSDGDFQYSTEKSNVYCTTGMRFTGDTPERVSLMLTAFQTFKNREIIKHIAAHGTPPATENAAGGRTTVRGAVRL